jgi:hypothetical protein
MDGTSLFDVMMKKIVTLVFVVVMVVVLVVVAAAAAVIMFSEDSHCTVTFILSYRLVSLLQFTLAMLLLC